MTKESTAGQHSSMSAVLEALGIDMPEPLLVEDVPEVQLSYLAPSGGAVSDLASAVEEVVHGIKDPFIGVTGKGEPYKMDAYGEGRLGHFSAPAFANVAPVKVPSLMSA